MKVSCAKCGEYVEGDDADAMLGWFNVHQQISHEGE